MGILSRYSDRYGGSSSGYCWRRRGGGKGFLMRGIRGRRYGVERVLVDRGFSLRIVRLRNLFCSVCSRSVMGVMLVSVYRLAEG